MQIKARQIILFSLLLLAMMAFSCKGDDDTPITPGGPGTTPEDSTTLDYALFLLSLLTNCGKVVQ